MTSTAYRLPPTYLGYNLIGGAPIYGPTWVRIDASWPTVEPRRGVWNFSMLDRQVRSVLAHHARVQLILGYTPSWAGARQTAAPRNQYDWDFYVTTVARHFGWRVAAYEPWNEPNLPQFYTGTQYRMFQLSRAAYQDIHRHVRRVTVLSPAWSPGGAAWERNWIRFGGLRYADAISFHVYPSYLYQVGKWTNEFRANLIARHVYKPLWATEVGCNTNLSPCRYGKAAAARFIKGELHILHEDRVQVAMLYPMVGTRPWWPGLDDIKGYLPSLRYAY